MEQITNLRIDSNSLKKFSAPETWQITGGDTLSVNLMTKEVNSICFLKTLINKKLIFRLNQV